MSAYREVLYSADPVSALSQMETNVTAMPAGAEPDLLRIYASTALTLARHHIESPTKDQTERYSREQSVIEALGDMDDGNWPARPPAAIDAPDCCRHGVPFSADCPDCEE